MDRKKRFLRHSLVLLVRMVQRFQRRSLVQRHNPNHKVQPFRLHTMDH
jgi:hypothetical protein